MNKLESYWRFQEAESHFNFMQASVRRLASAWLLAAFGAVAVLSKSDQDVTWLIPPLQLAQIVLVMGAFGLLALWILDMLVYQRLLGAIFWSGLKMEHDHPDLPPIRAMMMIASEKTGMRKWMNFFYYIPLAGFAMVSAILSWIIVHEKWSPCSDLQCSPDAEFQNYIIAVLSAVSILVPLLFILIMFWKIGHSGEAEDAAYFGNKNFTKLAAEKKYENIVKNRKKANTAKKSGKK